MKIERFEDIEGWRLGREWTRMIDAATQQPYFARDFGLKDQITRASGSVMNNIAEGFDSGFNPEFMKCLRDAQRSASEVRSQHYVALDRNDISGGEFQAFDKETGRAHAKIGGLIAYLRRAKGKQPRTKNQEQ